MTEQKTKKLTRRDAIKILGAAAGATVLANLPSKWSTPELVEGVLPAHAQTSIAPLSILSCDLTVESFQNGAWSSNVFIGPIPIVGNVVVQFTLTFVNAFFTHDAPGPQIPNPFISNRSLNSNGQETINSTQSGLDPEIDTVSYDPLASSGSFSVLWEFADPSQGSGSCTQTVDWPIP